MCCRRNSAIDLMPYCARSGLHGQGQVLRDKDIAVQLKLLILIYECNIPLVVHYKSSDEAKTNILHQALDHQVASIDHSQLPETQVLTRHHRQSDERWETVGNAVNW